MVKVEENVPAKKPSPYLPSITLTDASISLFSILFPIQPSTIQEETLETLINFSKYNGPKATLLRKHALQLNATVAIIGSLKYIAIKKGSIASEKVSLLTRELAEDNLSSPDALLRTLAAEVLGRSCRCSSSPSFVNSTIQYLMDRIVNNREPYSRVGCSLALGTISSFMGGMASGPHLKNIVGIIHSLSSDAHCLVHTWALHSLWLTVESAGLMYDQYVNSTLTLITKLFMSETHGDTALQANLSDGGDNSQVLPAFGRILCALVGVLGPELQTSPRIRDLFFSLYDQLKNGEDPFAVAEAIKCAQQFILFSPKMVDVNTLVPFLQRQLIFDSASQVHLLRKAAIHCLYQLSQRDSISVLSAAVNDRLEEQLFALLDVETDAAINDEVKDILLNFLKSVAETKPTRWLNLCRSILSKTNNTNSSNGPPLPRASSVHGEDDDMASPTETAPPPKKNETQGGLVLILLPRWRTQRFALTCLRKVISVAYASGIKEHFNLGLARQRQAKFSDEDVAADYLIFKLVDLIRISFGTATSNLYELKLEGLLLLKDILQVSYFKLLIRIY